MGDDERVDLIDLPFPAKNMRLVTIQLCDGTSRPWDGTPFKMAIAEVRVLEDRLIAKAYPNEFIVDFFSTLYPLMLYLKPPGHDG